MLEQKLERNTFTHLFTTGTTSFGNPPPPNWKREDPRDSDPRVMHICFAVREEHVYPFSGTFDEMLVNNPGYIAEKILEQISFPGAETSFIHINIPLHSGYNPCLKDICEEINALAANMNFAAVYFINATAYDYTKANIHGHRPYKGFHGIKLTFGVSSKRPVQPECKLTSRDTNLPAYYTG